MTNKTLPKNCGLPYLPRNYFSYKLLRVNRRKNNFIYVFHCLKILAHTTGFVHILSFTGGGRKEGCRPNNYPTILISLIYKSFENFDRADTVKADNFCV